MVEAKGRKAADDNIDTVYMQVGASFHDSPRHLLPTNSRL